MEWPARNGDHAGTALWFGFKAASRAFRLMTRFEGQLPSTCVMGHSRAGLIAPAAWLAFLFLFIAGTGLEIGHLPGYSNPDPKNLGMDGSQKVLSNPWGVKESIASERPRFMETPRRRGSRSPL